MIGEPNYPTANKKPAFKSEFSMGMYDFQRFHDMLRVADSFAFRVARGEYGEMKNLFAVLNTLYANWKPILYRSGIVKDTDLLFEELQKDIARSEKIQMTNKMFFSPMPNHFIVRTANKLLKLHREVMTIKQWVGLGIQVKGEMSKRKMIKLGMRGVDAPRISGGSD